MCCISHKEYQTMESDGEPTVLNAELICKIARKRNMYETPELNECIYAHNLSISKLANLEAFVNVTSLYLERNALRSLDGVESLPKLKYLNVNYNLIEEVKFQGLLQSLASLEELHASNNIISHLILPSQPLPQLRVLKLARNRMQTLPDLTLFEHIEVFDISQNCIETVGDFSNFLINCIPKSVKQLYIKPNTFTGTLKRFRQLTITNCKGLVFLDDAKVTAEEIEIAEAELAGGQEAANQVRRKKAEDTLRAQESQMKAFRDFQNSYDDSEQLRRELLIFVNQL